MVQAGQVFGRLTVIRQSTKWPLRFLCRCVCTNTTVERAVNLTAGRITSCGCLGRELWKQWVASHGMNRLPRQMDSPTYRSWMSMVRRVGDPNSTGFLKYGGAGVRIDPRWLGPAGYEIFRIEMGERPSLKHSLTRFLDTGDYRKGNVVWGDAAHQTAQRLGKRAMLRLRKIHEQNRATEEK